MPSVDEKDAADCFEEGKEARFCNKPKEDNPYPEGANAHDAWLDGWKTADDRSNAKTRGYN